MNGHGINPGVVFLGLEGFRVLAAVEADGELAVLVETTATVVGCPSCGVRATAKDRREVEVRDLPAGGRPVRLRWRKRIWCCREGSCERKTWTEWHPQIGPRRSLTERARREAARRVGQDGATVAAVARELGVSWDTVMVAVVDYGTPLADSLTLEGVFALGMDEHRWRHRPHGWATGLCDLERGRLIEVIPGRSGAGIRGFLAAQPAEVRAGVEVVALDPWRGYLGPVRHLLPRAEVVVDHFHLISLANGVVTEVRQRTQQQVMRHRGRKGDPLFGIRHLLLRGRERVSPSAWQRLETALHHPHGDRYEEVACAWMAKELLRDVYAASDLEAATDSLDEFHRWCQEVEVPEVDRLARTVTTWQEEILAYHRTGLSNGMTEAINLLIEKIRRLGHGFRNFGNYRLRLLLHCGVSWDTPVTGKIRGRRPSLVA